VIVLPADAVVVLVGISGSGKSTFAKAHFAPTEILSSDAFRAIVTDDESDQSVTEAAFALLHAVLDARLARGRLSVVDATNVEEWGRRQLLEIAHRRNRPAVAVVLDLPVELCLERLAGRAHRAVPPHAVRRQQRELRRWLPTLGDEGFEAVHVIGSEEAVDAATIQRAARAAPIPSADNAMSRRNRARHDDARSSNRHRNA
jgi:protein phosphatase